MSIDAQESITSSRTSGFFEKSASITQLRQESRTYLSPPLWVKRHPSPGPMLLCGRIVTVVGFRLAFFLRILKPTEFAPEVHIFA